MKYEVREASLKDRTDLLLLAKQFVKEAPEFYSWNPSKVEADLDGIMANPNYGILLLIHDEIPVGMLAFTVSELPFTGKVVGYELAWFLEKQHRKGRTALLLVKRYEEILKEAGVEIAALSSIAGLRSLETLYKRLGYEKMETTFIRSL